MINYSSNISVVIKAKLEQIQALQNNPDAILRTVALTVLPELRKRVHVLGKDSSGAQIGSYSPGYMVLRTGAYKNADKISKGKNKGKLKNSGRFTKGKLVFEQDGFAIEENIKGRTRPKYNRDSDTKVILSLTRQMENDLTVVPTGTKSYGIGYNNPLNFKKAQYCEATYKKPILTKLTNEEIELARNTAQEFTTEYLKTL